MPDIDFHDSFDISATGSVWDVSTPTWSLGNLVVMGVSCAADAGASGITMSGVAGWIAGPATSGTGADGRTVKMALWWTTAARAATKPSVTGPASRTDVRVWISRTETPPSVTPLITGTFAGSSSSTVWAPVLTTTAGKHCVIQWSGRYRNASTVGGNPLSTPLNGFRNVEATTGTDGFPSQFQQCHDGVAGDSIPLRVLANTATAPASVAVAVAIAWGITPDANHAGRLLTHRIIHPPALQKRF